MHTRIQYTHAHTYTHIHACAHMHTHIHVHTHTRAHMHTQNDLYYNIAHHNSSNKSSIEHIPHAQNLK